MLSLEIWNEYQVYSGDELNHVSDHVFTEDEDETVFKDEIKEQVEDE